MEDQHLISVDELRAAGALDVPAAWRKSLGQPDRDLFSDLTDDGGAGIEEQPLTEIGVTSDGSDDESR